MDCPVCSKNNTESRFIQNDYPILHCKDCDHLFTDYKPSAQEVKQIYSNVYFLKGAVIQPYLTPIMNQYVMFCTLF